MYHRRKEKKKKEKLIEYLNNNYTKNEALNKIPKYYINLDRSEDRRKHIEEEIEKYQIENMYRFKAIDGSKKEEKNVNFITDYDNYIDYTLACTLSHLECIKKAGEKGVFPFIIFEDDMNFFLMPKWKINIDEIIEELPDDCEILQLTTHLIKDNNYGFTKGSQFSAGAYLVTKQGYNKIMEKLYYNNKWNLIKDDIKLGTFYADWIFFILKSYFTRPCLFLLDSDGLKSTLNHGDGRESINNIILSDYY